MKRSEQISRLIQAIEKVFPDWDDRVLAETAESIIDGRPNYDALRGVDPEEQDNFHTAVNHAMVEMGLIPGRFSAN